MRFMHLIYVKYVFKQSVLGVMQISFKEINCNICYGISS